MNYKKKTVRDIDVKGKKVLCRCHFKVPHDKATAELGYRPRDLLQTLRDTIAWSRGELEAAPAGG